MPFLQQGNSAVVTVPAGQSIAIGAPVDSSANVLIPIGQRGGPSAVVTGQISQVFGPFPSGTTITVVAAKGQVEYVVGSSPVAGSSSAGTGVQKAFGNIAGRLALPNFFDNTKTACMSRSYIYFGDDFSSLQIECPNYYVAGFGNAPLDGAEKGPGAAATITATLEYPIGTIAGQFTWNGAVQGSIPDGGILLSDVLSGLVGKARTFGRISIFRTCAPGMVYASSTTTPTLSQDEFRTTGATDQTGNLSAVGSAGPNQYTPTAVIALTSKESVYLTGDSLVYGNSPDITNDGLGAIGLFARACALRFIPYINAGVGSQQAQFFKNSFAQQLATMQWHSRLWGNLGTNDNSASRTPAQIVADLNIIYNAIRAAYPNMRIFHATYPPRMTTTTDFYTTTGGQSHSTPTFPPKLRAATMAVMQGQITALNGVIDIRPSFVSADGAETWYVPPNARTFADATMTLSSTALNSAAGAAFTFADVGSTVIVQNAGNAAGNTNLVTTIVAYVSATQVTLANSCLATAGVTGVNGYISPQFLTTDGTHTTAVANRRLLNSGCFTQALPQS